MKHLSIILVLLRSITGRFRLLPGFLFILLLVQPSISADIQAQSNENTIYLPLVLQQESDPAQIYPPEAEQWLSLLNQYRSVAGLSRVSHDKAMSTALDLHTQYLLLNPAQVNFHEEYEDKSGYTPAGEIAGGQSNMAKKGGTTLSQQESMELWIGYPSHRYHILHPDLITSGFDLSCDLANCYSGLNIQGNLPPSYQISSVNVVYPASGQVDIPAVTFPISWSFYMPWTGAEDDDQEADLLSGQLFDQNNQVVAVTLTEPNHSDGRWEYRNQLLMTPNQPLLSQHTYRVEMSARFLGQTLTRSYYFSTR